MKVLAIGASRHIGYHASVTFLQQGHTVVFAVRNPSALENDPVVGPFVTSAKAKLVKCDALVEDDLRKAWTAALADETPVDLVLFSVGATGGKISLTKGVIIDPINLCTTGFLNTLSTYPSSLPKPRVVAISSLGVTTESRAVTPYAIRPVYMTIKIPHRDKRGMHRIAAYVSGRPWSDADQKLLGDETELFPQDWKAKLAEGSWGSDKVIVVQAALLTDGAEKKQYRTGGNELTGLYTISRLDVAHFITDGLLNNWADYQGKDVSIGY